MRSYAVPLHRVAASALFVPYGACFASLRRLEPAAAFPRRCSKQHVFILLTTPGVCAPNGSTACAKRMPFALQRSSCACRTTSTSLLGDAKCMLKSAVVAARMPTYKIDARLVNGRKRRHTLVCQLRRTFVWLHSPSPAPLNARLVAIRGRARDSAQLDARQRQPLLHRHPRVNGRVSHGALSRNSETQSRRGTS